MAMRRSLAALAAATALLMPLANECTGQPTGDRQGPAGTQPDGYQDAQHVVVYRNADDVPNVAVFCLGPHGWASTLSGTDAAENKTAVLVRYPEYDKTCAG